MGKQSSISVVIPNYCGQSLLEKYLPYLLSALNSSKQVSSYEVIIVDDASLDNSVTFLETFYPNILLLQNEKNGNPLTITERGFLLCLKRKKNRFA